MDNKMNFKRLYENSGKEIQQTIIRMWEEYAPAMVEAYRDQLEDILKDNISNNIVVEDMSQWEPTNEDWTQIVDSDIWRKWKTKDADRTKEENIVPIQYWPYKHQYDSWKTLLKGNKSIVVTSGTGSGKTECFMIPLIQDLVFEQDPSRDNAIEAIFLYPLNALMEDQRERMSNYIRFSQSNQPTKSKKNITFAVYNGNTPEDNTPIGLYYNEIGSRAEIRSKKPNILFTNPSMLEYMLLRKKDQGLFSDKLKWIVIDEAHTYSGSSGAELALLLKRVLHACGLTPDKVKFATSSATIGNNDNQLKQFIADITGQNTTQIEIIKGQRTMPKSLSENKAQLLHTNNFILLNQLFPEGTIEEKLKLLDSLTEQELKVRLHFFVKALTTGLYVDPTKDLTPNGKFNLLTNIPLVDGKLDPYPLNAYYCSQCGAILGYGELDNNNRYRRDIKELSTLDDELEMDDNDDDDDSINNTFSPKDSEPSKFFIGIASNPPYATPTNIVDGNRLDNAYNGSLVYSEIKKKDGKEIQECPCCGANGAKGASPLHSFHLSADFIGRLIAPILLDQTCEVEENKDENIDPEKLPRQGRKYITFADSRQSAAGPTLKQNLETEEVWVIGVLYKNLYNRRPLSRNEHQRYNELDTRNIYDKDLTREETQEYNNLCLRKNICSEHLTWHEALNTLLEDDNCSAMCMAFATNDKDEDMEQLKRKYVLSALYRTMNKRPANGKNSPENWGLIHIHYPDIEILNSREIPDEVKYFNNLISVEENKISSKDWHDFVKLFIDYNIRSNQSMFFKLYREENGRPVASVKDWKEIDINDIRNYRTEDGPRRQIEQPEFSDTKPNRYVMLLCSLLGKDRVKDLTQAERDAIKGVLSALWEALTTNQIVEKSEKIEWDWKEKPKKFKEWAQSKKADDIYMNLTRIAFKLYDEKVQFDEHLKIPLDTTLKGYSPYRGEDGKYNVKCVERDWNKLDPDESKNVKEWFNTNRADIAHRWSVKLERILECICSKKNTLYIQAEHTAQVARSVIKEKTDKFKQGKLNIMACSTTMEMGVDLGDLELVVMNNVPPQPANYKQRAGRAGRGDQNKSASVTLCGGDAIGETLLKNPLEGFIQRTVAPPRIDLARASRQLIQRHINSLLLREFAKGSDIGIAGGQDNEEDKGWRICDLFTKYSLEDVQNPNNKDKRYIRVKDNSNGGSIVFPCSYDDLMNDNVHDASSFRKFIEQLDEWSNKGKVIKEAIKLLTKGTTLEGSDTITLIQDTKKSIIAIAEDIHTELLAIKELWKADYEKDSNPTTKAGRSLYWQFANILNANLLTYLSNHQFTPNANMPVGIVEMILKEKSSFWDKTENPTRDLRTALSEYAPGRLVFVNGRTYRMGGVNWNKKRPYHEIKCCTQGHTWMGVKNICPICDGPRVDWAHFGESIKMITPTGYYPSDVSRITKKEAMNIELGVELIGVGNWEENRSHKLYALRTNKDAYNSHIVYYDKGHGYGYHICTKCGYAVPAPNKWDGKESHLINLMYSEVKKVNRETGQEEEYSQHNYRSYECKMDENNTCGNILTNIVLGGSIQTDYCEIALYDHRALNLSRMTANEGNIKIAHTLGVLLCSSLSQKVGFDRGELDFVVRTQNSEVSLCIFDVAKGGSGRAKLLLYLISELFDNARDVLNDGCANVQQILDRNTMRYAEFIDIEGAKAWLNAEYENRIIIPDGFPRSSQNSSYAEMANAIQQTANPNNVYLFVNNDFLRWNYDGNGEKDYPCWKSCREDMKPRGSNKYNLTVINAPNIIPAEYSVILAPLKDSMCLKSAAWNNDIYKPLAIVGDVLYITNVDDYTYIDEKWAADCVWKCKCNECTDIIINDWKYQTDTDAMDCIEIYPYKKTTTKNLLNILESDPLAKFFDSAKDCTELTIEYSDRFLYSQLGMITTHQLIMNVIEKAGCSSYAITYKINIEKKDGESGIAYNDEKRHLTDNIDKSYLVDYMRWFVNPDNNDNIKVDKCRYKELNHDRTLSIKSDKGHTLIIRPDGGFGRGWKLDTDTARENGKWYNNKCTVTDDIPIFSRPEDGRHLYYVIYKRPTNN